MTAGPQVTNPEKVLMQINKYVHPCERIPHFVRPEDMALFAEDYKKKENERIQEHLIAFDKLLTENLCGAQENNKTRIRRYQREYLPESGCDNEHPPRYG